MHLLQQHDVGKIAELDSVEQAWLLDALFVFQGDYTFCVRKHDGKEGDMLYAHLMLGRYTEVFKLF